MRSCEKRRPAPRRRAAIAAAALSSLGLSLSAAAETAQTARVFADCDVCPQMVALPGGRFVMGSPETEAERLESEGPRTAVTIAPFALARTETTFAIWDACAADGFCRAVPVGTVDAEDGGVEGDLGFGRDQRPVIEVSWNDITGEAVAEPGFLAWLNSRPGVEGAPYRLPSEAEWEYAARGGAQTAYSFGESAEGIGAFVWFRETSGMRTNPVGLLRPNGFGLYDMTGNVWEWTQDCWNETLDATLQGGSARMTGDCAAAVIRGGAWNNARPWLRVAVRGWDRRDLRNAVVGFRVARTLVQE